MKQRAFDLLGNIAIVNFPKEASSKDKREFAKKILKENKGIKTVLEKIGKVKGRLRKIKTKFLAGENTKEVLYRENGCVFRFNIDTTYFSPRLSSERKEIASKIKSGEKVLVMFAGVAPFSIVIAKNSNPSKVVSNEINKEANRYGKLNIELNNLKDKIEMADGDAKKVADRLVKNKEKFDVIVMPRPNLKETFLKQAFMLSKKATRIYYYTFCSCDKEAIKKEIENIKKEAGRYKKKIKILGKKVAGAVAPYKIRLRIDFRVV
jgi:tRNA (guanine37-N1)-methyltransferase